MPRRALCGAHVVMDIAGGLDASGRGTHAVTPSAMSSVTATAATSRAVRCSVGLRLKRFQLPQSDLVVGFNRECPFERVTRGLPVPKLHQRAAEHVRAARPQRLAVA